MKKGRVDRVVNVYTFLCVVFLICAQQECWSASDISEPNHGRLKVVEEGGYGKDVFCLKDGAWTNLTRFSKPNDIYDYRSSPEGNHAFVWHKDGSYRVLSIYDLKDLTLEKDLALGFGGEVRWSTDDQLVHIYGCGSGCAQARVFDREGNTVFEIGGRPVALSPSGRYLALYTVSWVGDERDFELYDLTNQYLIFKKVPLVTVNGVGQLTAIDWKDEKTITIHYTGAGGSRASTEEGRYPERQVSIDLSGYGGG